MLRCRLVVLTAIAALAAPGVCPVAAEVGPASASAEAATPLDVLAAEQDGLVEVRFIANDSRSAQVVVKNRSDRPLTLRLPAAFAGVPVLAQMGQAGAGFGAGGIGGTPQNVGGGGMQNQGMGIGGQMGGNPFCWVAREVYGVHDRRWLTFREWMIWRAPVWLQEGYRLHGEALADWLRERPAAKAALRGLMDLVVAGQEPRPAVAQLRVTVPAGDNHATPFTVVAGKTMAIRVPTVCLEYGRREPTPRMPYRLEPLAKVSQDPKLALILGGLASGQLSQKVAQAAAWHLSSGRTWEQLAAEVIDRAGGDPDLPVFSPAELAAAKRAVDIATRLATEPPPAVTAETSAP
jgi:hypothetical protein